MKGTYYGNTTFARIRTNREGQSGIWHVPNAYEFVREAILRAVERNHLKRRRLNEAIAIGIEQADRGELFDLDLDQINAELDEEEGYAMDFARHFEPN